MNLTILHLYPQLMNLYGDHGNLLTLTRRCQWRDIKVKVINYETGDKLPANPDIIFGGGGQDSGQIQVADDLQIIAPQLQQLIQQGTPTLVVCGLYQLFGNFFRTSDGNIIDGISIFDLETTASSKRLTGNITIDSPKFGQIVGYENHSGRTKLSDNIQPLGTVLRGAGNNGNDHTEGAFYKNTIGTYLHGPLLPKNPHLADFLIQTALQRKYGTKQKLAKLDDELENKAHKTAASRPV